MSAAKPEQLHELWGRYHEAGDHIGLASLYEQGAIVLAPDGKQVSGRNAIAELYKHVIAAGLAFEDFEQRVPVVCGDLALTAMRLHDGTMTCEIARRQTDGSWLWVIDVPRFSVGD